MPEVVIAFFIFLVGIATGFFDATVGGGGLISIPLLMFTGLPPHVAIATDRFGSLGQTLASLPKYWKAQKIVWRYVPIFTVFSVVSAYIGANFLLNIDENTLKNIVGILLFLLLPITFLKRNLGTQTNHTSSIQKMIGLALFFALMTFGAFFGGGIGPLIFYVLMFFLGFTITEANATKIIPYFLLSIISVVIFSSNGIVDFTSGLILLAGMAIGGYLGAHFAIQKGDVWVKRLFTFIVVLSALKLLLT